MDNNSGAAIGFAATIDAAKKVITLDPTNALAEGAVYVAISADHWDAAGNQGAQRTATFTVRPPAPTALVVTAGDTKLDLSWTAPTLASGVSLSGYDVHYTSADAGTVADDAAVQTGQTPSPGDGWVAASHSGTGTTAEITGLTNTTEYRVRVRSRTAAGASAWLAGTGTPAVGNVLVSNVGQSDTAGESMQRRTRAQCFTTGSAIGGYVSGASTWASRA